MDPSLSPTFDPDALTFRNYLQRSPNLPSSSPASSPSIPPIPSYQELSVLQQELQYLSEQATLRYERYSNELLRLEGGSSLAQSKDSSVTLTPTSANSMSNQGLAYNSSAAGNASTVGARASASPSASSPSSFSSNPRTGASTGTPASGAATNSAPSLVKLGVVTLKLKRSDAAESSKTDDEQSSSSTPNTIRIRTGTPSLSQDGFQKKKKKRELDEDMASHTKAKRSDDFALNKSMSPQPVKLNPNRHSAPKASQQRTGDKAHGGSQQKKKKNSENQTEKSQRPIPKSQEVQEDFSKVKVANQVPIQTFWASMEPYFRPFTESDRTVLEEDGDQVTPLLIPPLGKHYLDAWTEEDRLLLPLDGFDSRRNSVDSNKDPTSSRNIVNSQPFELTDENIDQDEVSCGPLTERIICSLISEEVVDSKELKQDEDVSAPSPSPAALQSNARNYAELEERIKRELRYIGLLGNDEINWDAREDDEISITLRSLQKELREVMKVNKSRKQRLLGLVNNHLAYQEYNTILDDLDKQVEQGYLKRFRMTKSKKKKAATPKALSENALSAMDRRRRFVQGVGPIFPAENYTIPTTSIYQDELQPKTTSGVPSYRELNGLS
ncbi:Transcriptional regulator [Mortierella polycephala]|uniref:Transcriptional regulator n=1 Tax=Mortierella polycephala TaxID=41804 RepID=A0A9P6U493_9FUNG|nr:Transcriptional regulator [Mortierella polycephala]